MPDEERSVQRFKEELEASPNAFPLFTADEYRELVAKLPGRKPPCYFCRDEQILQCSDSGEECDRFVRYTNRGARQAGQE